MKKNQMIKIINEMTSHWASRCELCGQSLERKALISKEDLIAVLTEGDSK